MSTYSATHGGPDALGVPLHDFSTNANACGPCPDALAAISAADATRYPDPSYHHLRARIADFHGTAVDRVHVAASASEFIWRMTAAIAALGGRGVAVPQPAYGDYARAAAAHGLALVADEQAPLVWRCDPASPTGQAADTLRVPRESSATVVVDCAYAPLRLDGPASAVSIAMSPALPKAWTLWTPNKALGLTGIRGAYALAPQGQGDGALADRLQALQPSWPIGAHGVAMLHSWLEPATQRWLAQSHDRLRDWKRQQTERLAAVGWRCLPSVTSFFCATPPVDPRGRGLDALLQHLRAAHGIKLRDTASLGLPGFVRLNVMPPDAQQALLAALVRWG